MLRLLLLLPLVASTALAAQADCKSLYFRGTVLSYQTAAAFPAAPEDKEMYFVADDGPKQPVNLCGFTFSPNHKNNSLSVTTSNWSAFKPLLKSIRRSSKGSELVMANPTSANGILSDPQFLILDPVKQILSYEAGSYSSNTIGVKVDNGNLQPLFYKYKNTPLKYSSNNKILDVYIKSNDGTDYTWQRATIDLKHSKITFYKTAVMPDK